VGTTMNVSDNNYHGILYAGIAYFGNIQRLLQDPYVGIALNESNQQLLWDPICGYCIEW